MNNIFVSIYYFYIVITNRGGNTRAFPCTQMIRVKFKDICRLQTTLEVKHLRIILSITLIRYLVFEADRRVAAARPRPWSPWTLRPQPPRPPARPPRPPPHHAPQLHSKVVGTMK